jgi:protein disulfide-isomerase
MFEFSPTRPTLSVMKTLLLPVAVALAGMLTLHAGSEWGTDYKAALETAAKQKRLVLLDFTGSDWCGWCIKMDKDTFAKPEFEKFAADNLVLLEVDFPNNKPQPEAIKAQNAGLAKKFGVDGYPTFVLVDASGKEVARHVGYLQGGPAAFIDWVKAAK